METPQDRAKALFLQALDLSTSDDRQALLDRECGDDGSLRAEVEGLLAALDEPHADDFLEQPAACAHVRNRPTVSEVAGDTIGPYELVAKIGEGGFGVVFLANQSEPVRRQVALKVIKPGMDSHEVVARFEAERQALALMDHSNIARVYDGGTTESGRPYFVMELVKGIPITRFCDEHRLNMRERLTFFGTVCRAIQHAHQKGIIHRDVKPSNVLITMEDGVPVPKVIDFGVAKAVNQPFTEETMVTGFGQMIGTPRYMSPEQTAISGLDIDTRSDIYSLGVLLYELLTGTTPLEEGSLGGMDFDEVIRRIREEDPPRPSLRLTSPGESSAEIAGLRRTDPKRLGNLLRGDLDWIVMKALEKDRDRRYETADAFAADVERFLSDEPVKARPPSLPYQMRKFARRNLVGVVAVGAIASTLVATAVISAALLFLMYDGLRQAEQERRVSGSVLEFLTNDLLSPASPEVQPDRDLTVRELFERAAGRIDHRFDDSPETEAMIRMTIGLSLRALAEPEQAELHLTRALNLRRDYLGDKHPATLDSMRELGNCYLWMDQPEKAAPLIEGAYKLSQEAFGAEDFETLESMRMLFVLRRQQHQHDVAAELLREYLRLSRQVYGENHPTTLEAKWWRAEELHAQSKLYQAEALFVEASAGFEKFYGEGHPQTVDCNSALALLYLDQRRFEEAETLLLHTIKMSRRAIGDEHPKTLFAMHNLVMVYGAQGRFDEADRLLEKCLAAARRTFGEESSTVKAWSAEANQAAIPYPMRLTPMHDSSNVAPAPPPAPPTLGDPPTPLPDDPDTEPPPA